MLVKLIFRWNVSLRELFMIIKNLKINYLYKNKWIRAIILLIIHLENILK